MTEILQNCDTIHIIESRCKILRVGYTYKYVKGRKNLMEKIATFADRLKSLLEEKGLTQADICRLAHVDRSLMTKYLKGTKFPKIDTIRRIANVLYVNPDWLEGFDADKVPKPVQLSPLEMDFVMGFRNLSGDDKYFILEYIKKKQE